MKSILLIIVIAFISSCQQDKTSKYTETYSFKDSTISNGKKLTYAFACMNCHQIPGLKGVPGNLGPSLVDWSQRKFIAGKIQNNPKNLMRWLRQPHMIEGSTTMPKMKISQEQALAISAFLFTLGSEK